MDASKILREARAPHEGKDASEAFAKRMAEMQQEFAQMQTIQHQLKQDEAQLQKKLHPLQRDLDDVSKQLTAAEQRRQKLESELKSCEEEITRLSQKKESAQARIFAVTAEAENRRVDKLNTAIGGNPALQSKLQAQKDAGAVPAGGGGGAGDVDLMGDFFSSALASSCPSTSVPPAAAAPAGVPASCDVTGLAGLLAPSATPAPSASLGVAAPPGNSVSDLSGIDFNAVAAPKPPPPPPPIPGAPASTTTPSHSPNQPDPFMNLLMGPTGR